ncbi:pantetheine-phosphate adenylyltransferase [Actinoplanes xinjiangensis]|uniref:pantetheine-phosphate adenylyltransferase n=1 Tax=Actinoplanes xinjiangensis TaxID=512350 RepID=UPI003413E4B9
MAARFHGATRHLRVKRRQPHRVRAVDDEIGESQHPAILPQGHRTGRHHSGGSDPSARRAVRGPVGIRCVVLCSSLKPVRNGVRREARPGSGSAYSGSVPHASDGGPGSAGAVYPGTFDPFTPGHFDVVDRSRRMFDRVTVLVAVNAGKQPSGTAAARAREIRALLPAGWENVVVDAWQGLTVDYCRRTGCGVIIRGVRNSTDYLHEYELAAMNEALGVTTLLVPARPELVTMSSTALRALRP